MTRKEREKAIDALKISAPIMAVTQEEFNDYIQTLNKIMDLLEQEPKTGRWIPVSERLPEKDGRFLTYIENPYDIQLSYIMVCDYINQTWCPDDETASNNVVEWMPLPEKPYKGESEG